MDLLEKLVCEILNPAPTLSTPLASKAKGRAITIAQRSSRPHPLRKTDARLLDATQSASGIDDAPAPMGNEDVREHIHGR